MKDDVYSTDTEEQILKIVELSKGNPGAAIALTKVMGLMPHFNDRPTVIDTLLERKVSPSDIWIVYKDKCNFDAKLTLKALTHWQSFSDMPFDQFIKLLSKLYLGRLI